MAFVDYPDVLIGVGIFNFLRYWRGMSVTSDRISGNAEDLFVFW
jgi:hypothetical protein